MIKKKKYLSIHINLPKNLKSKENTCVAKKKIQQITDVSIFLAKV